MKMKQEIVKGDMESRILKDFITWKISERSEKKLKINKKKQIQKERKETAKALESSWKLIRICKEIISETKGEWIDRKNYEDIRKKIQKGEERNKRPELVKKTKYRTRR